MLGSWHSGVKFKCLLLCAGPQAPLCWHQALRTVYMFIAETADDDGSSLFGGTCSTSCWAKKSSFFCACAMKFSNFWGHGACLSWLSCLTGVVFFPCFFCMTLLISRSYLLRMSLSLNIAPACTIDTTKVSAKSPKVFTFGGFPAATCAWLSIRGVPFSWMSVGCRIVGQGMSPISDCQEKDFTWLYIAVDFCRRCLHQLVHQYSFKTDIPSSLGHSAGTFFHVFRRLSSSFKFLPGSIAFEWIDCLTLSHTKAWLHLPDELSDWMMGSTCSKLMSSLQYHHPSSRCRSVTAGSDPGQLGWSLRFHFIWDLIYLADVDSAQFCRVDLVVPDLTDLIS